MKSLPPHVLLLTPGGHIIQFLVVVAFSSIAFLIVKIAYRLTLHPLAKFPGPVLAASTNLYCGFYDIFRTGGVVKKLPKLHAKYGPIIRIGPDELHVFDFDSYNEVFKIGTKYAKPHVSSTDTFSHSLLHISSPRQAKARKDNYTPFFSPAAVRRLEPLLHSILRKWLNHLRHASTDGSVIDMSRAFKCFTLDVVTQYSFAQDVGGTDAPGFVHPIIEASAALDDAFTFSRYFPTLKGIVDVVAGLLPASIAKRVFPAAADLQKYVASCRVHLENLLKDDDKTNEANQTIFQDIMKSDDASSNKPTLSLDQLTADAVLMVSAGMSTTAYTSHVGCWNLLQQPEILQKLVKELNQVVPELDSDWTPPALEQLEQLPYLRAVIKESLRLSYGVPGRMARVVPPNGTSVGGLFVPGGTLLSHSPYVYHHDETVFPNSFTFNPDRWLGDDAAMLERHLLSFSKGSRSCLGINLAYAQLTLIFAMLYRYFEVDNFGTTAKDMEWKDRFVPISNSTLKVKLITKN